MKKQTKINRGRLQRGIYLLPNLMTAMNIFCGFYAVIAAIDQNFVQAAVAIMIAGIFDSLDGKIARATRTTSKFGVEFDSLADLISFGLAPGVMMYLWALKPLGRMGWLAAFLFMTCGALRLARFNTQAGKSSGDYFTGLPIPAGAGMNAATVLIFDKFSIPGETAPVAILVLIYLLSFLMVSTIKYHSFKNPELFKKKNFDLLVISILVLIFIAAQPSIALFLFGLAYIASGPLNTIRRYRESADQPAEVRSADEQETGTI